MVLDIVRAGYYLGRGNLLLLSNSDVDRYNATVLLEKGTRYLERLYGRHPTAILNYMLKDTRSKITSTRTKLGH